MAYVLFLSVLFIGIVGCVKESIKHTTSDTVNITQYFVCFIGIIALADKVGNGVAAVPGFAYAVTTKTTFDIVNRNIRNHSEC